MNYPQAFQDLVDCFKRLPGIGGKSAERLAYHVLSMDKKYVDEFSAAIGSIQTKIHYCKKCGHICEGEICDICQDPDRDQTTICIVEDPKDVFASLFERLDDSIKEVIIATNPTRDGETTALYLAKLLSKKNINTSRIANGLPIGSNIDYADELTLLKSLEGRKKI